MVYQIWSEGFVATGESAHAHVMGEVEAPSFKEACDKLLANDPYYNSTSGTYWGCRLFHDEAEARRSYG